VIGRAQLDLSAGERLHRLPSARSSGSIGTSGADRSVLWPDSLLPYSAVPVAHLKGLGRPFSSVAISRSPGARLQARLWASIHARRLCGQGSARGGGAATIAAAAAAPEAGGGPHQVAASRGRLLLARQVAGDLAQ
jgi:hypothetical protein